MGRVSLICFTYAYGAKWSDLIESDIEEDSEPRSEDKTDPSKQNETTRDQWGAKSKSEKTERLTLYMPHAFTACNLQVSKQSALMRRGRRAALRRLGRPLCLTLIETLTRA